MSHIKLMSALASPARVLKHVEATDERPFGLWAVLGVVAIAGSAIYGSSLSHPFPGIDLYRGAVWLTFSAGLSWPILLAGLKWLTRLSWTALIHACLVTIAYGEMILLVGAIANTLYAPSEAVALPLNVGVVAVSNVVMMTSLAVQLGSLRVPIWKTVSAWITLLVGSGALFFWQFHRWLDL